MANLIREWKKQKILGMADALKGGPPRILGVRIFCEETGRYLVSIDGEPQLVTPEEFKRLDAEHGMMFGHRVITKKTNESGTEKKTGHGSVVGQKEN